MSIRTVSPRRYGAVASAPDMATFGKSIPTLPSGEEREALSRSHPSARTTRGDLLRSPLAGCLLVGRRTNGSTMDGAGSIRMPEPICPVVDTTLKSGSARP